VAGNPDTVFRDFPRSKFPFTVELLDAETREVRWSVTIEGPGGVVRYLVQGSVQQQTGGGDREGHDLFRISRKVRGNTQQGH
jgi:hypothetical protein